MGVAYETFWHLNPRKMKPIEKAYEMKMEARQNQMNLEGWLDGLYIQNAIASVMSKNAKYPKKPFDMFGTTKPKTPEEEAEEFKRYVEDMAMKRKAIKAMG